MKPVLINGIEHHPDCQNFMVAFIVDAIGHDIPYPGCSDVNSISLPEYYCPYFHESGDPKSDYYHVDDWVYKQRLNSCYPRNCPYRKSIKN